MIYCNNCGDGEKTANTIGVWPYPNFCSESCFKSFSEELADVQPIDPFGCIANTIKTASGHYFDLADPKPEDVDIESIAAALSKTCRFGGHCPEFYSVAQHSVLASLLSETHPFEVLLHDAAEAYVGDVVKPLKNMLGKQFHIVEQRVSIAIARKFKAFHSDTEEIKRCDHLMLKSEKIFFWPEDKEEWLGFKGLPIAYESIDCWDPKRAETEFLSRFNELVADRKDEDVVASQKMMSGLSDEQRRAVLGCFCTGCGAPNSSCACEA